MHILVVAKYIKALVICHQESVSDVVRLDTLLEYVHILVISKYILKVHHLQLLSQYNR